VTEDEAKARAEYDRLAAQFELDPENPHDDDTDLYWWEVEAT